MAHRSLSSRLLPPWLQPRHITLTREPSSFGDHATSYSYAMQNVIVVSPPEGLPTGVQAGTFGEYFGSSPLGIQERIGRLLTAQQFENSGTHDITHRLDPRSIQAIGNVLDLVLGFTVDDNVLRFEVPREYGDNPRVNHFLDSAARDVQRAAAGRAGGLFGRYFLGPILIGMPPR